MKKILFILILSAFLPAFANNAYCFSDFKTCNSVFFCTKQIYDSLCIPYLSAILNNREPVFIKLNKSFNNGIVAPFDEYNWKISQIDLIRCI